MTNLDKKRKAHDPDQLAKFGGQYDPKTGRTTINTPEQSAQAEVMFNRQRPDEDE